MRYKDPEDFFDGSPDYSTYEKYYAVGSEFFAKDNENINREKEFLKQGKNLSIIEIFKNKDDYSIWITYPKIFEEHDWDDDPRNDPTFKPKFNKTLVFTYIKRKDLSFLDGSFKDLLDSIKDHNFQICKNQKYKDW